MLGVQANPMFLLVLGMGCEAYRKTDMGGGWNTRRIGGGEGVRSQERRSKGGRGASTLDRSALKL